MEFGIKGSRRNQSSGLSDWFEQRFIRRAAWALGILWLCLIAIEFLERSSPSSEVFLSETLATAILFMATCVVFGILLLAYKNKAQTSRLLELRHQLSIQLALARDWDVLVEVIFAFCRQLIAETPPEMRLWFSEKISGEFSGVRLLDANGQATDLETGIDANDRTLMVVKMPELAEGVYSLRWSVHSAADGHITQGLVVFGIGEGADLGTATAVETDTAVAWQELTLRWLTFALFAAMLGGFAIPYLVLSPHKQLPTLGDVQHKARSRMFRLAFYCGLLAFLVGFAWAGWQAFNLASSVPGKLSIAAAGWQWLTQTQLGAFWWARQLIVLVAAGIFWVLSVRESAAPMPIWLTLLACLLLLALVLIQSLTSHAAALTENTALAVGVDALHTLAASFWVGGLLALVIGLLPLVRHNAHFTAMVKAGWRPFGKWAALSVAIVFITGFYSTSREVGSVGAMFTTLYGKTLSFKITLVLMVALIGAVNSMLLHPGLAAQVGRLLRKPAGWTPLTLRQLPRLFIAEVSIGLLVLLMAGIITAAPPARGAAYTAADNVAADLSQTVDDMIIKFTVDPNKAGQNIFTVRAVSARRPPPAEILRVILRFTYLDQDLGMDSVDMNEIEPELFLLSGNQLNLAGKWQIDVVVRRQGMEDSVASFEWIVPSSDSQ